MRSPTSTPPAQKGTQIPQRAAATLPSHSSRTKSARSPPGLTNEGGGRRRTHTGPLSHTVGPTNTARPDSGPASTADNHSPGTEKRLRPYNYTCPRPRPVTCVRACPIPCMALISSLDSAFRHQVTSLNLLFFYFHTQSLILGYS